MVLPAIIGAKAGETATKALTGDIYVRKTIQTVGKGKDKRLLEKELHVNPVTLGIGAVAVGGAALLTGAALWFMQKKPIVSQGKEFVRIAEEKDTTYKTVVDEPAIPAWTEEINKGPRLLSGGYSEETIVSYTCRVCDETMRADSSTLVKFLRVHAHPELPVTPVPYVSADYELVWIEPVYGDDIILYVERPGVPATYKEVVDKAGYTQWSTAMGIPYRKGPRLYQPNHGLTQREISGGYVFKDEIKTIGLKHWIRYHSDEKYTLGTEDRKVGGIINVEGGIF